MWCISTCLVNDSFKFPFSMPDSCFVAPPPSSVANGQESKVPPAGNERLALLGSIETFAKGKLKKAATVDKSGPLL